MNTLSLAFVLVYLEAFFEFKSCGFIYPHSEKLIIYDTSCDFVYQAPPCSHAYVERSGSLGMRFVHTKGMEIPYHACCYKLLIKRNSV